MIAWRPFIYVSMLKCQYSVQFFLYFLEHFNSKAEAIKTKYFMHHSLDFLLFGFVCYEDIQEYSDIILQEFSRHPKFPQFFKVHPPSYRPLTPLQSHLTCLSRGAERALDLFDYMIDTPSVREVLLRDPDLLVPLRSRLVADAAARVRPEPACVFGEQTAVQLVEAVRVLSDRIFGHVDAHGGPEA
jgi:hypothetical protein